MDDSQNYAKQFKETCDMYGKGSESHERKYYHFKLSIDPSDNPTPQQSHTLAEKLAQELFSAHECVIATHNDTGVIHSHIIVNAVSFETGKKLHMNPFEYSNSKDLADTLGKEMGFTPLDWRDKTAHNRRRAKTDIAFQKKILSNAERNISKRDTQGTASWKEALRQAIDEAKQICTDRTQFQKYLYDNFGVTMPRNTEKTVSFVHPAVGETYAVRGAKLGNGYTANRINHALEKNRQTQQGNQERSVFNARLLFESEDYTTEPTTRAYTTNPYSTTTSGQPYLQTRNGERITPRSISDISTELRNIGGAVEKIANRVSSASDGNNNHMAEKLYGNEPRHEKPTGGIIYTNREKPQSTATADKPVQPKPPEPTATTKEPERNVQQKPKRRAYSHDR